METVKTSETFMIKRPEVLDRSILKKDFIRYSPPSLATINNANVFISIDIAREDAYISLHDSYLSIELEVLKNADDTRYADNNAISLVNLGGIALFTEARLETSSKKLLETVEQVYQASVMYKMLSSANNELMSYFVKDTAAAVNNTRRNRLINDNDEKGTLFLHIPLSDIFGYALHQNKITYGLGYKLSLRTSSDIAASAVHRTIGDAAKIVIKDISWYVSHYTPSLENQSLVAGIIQKKEPVTMGYVGRKVITKQVNTNSNWSFELGVEAGIEVPIYIIVGFQTADRYGPAQDQNNGIFDQPDIISASCSIGSDRYPDNRFTLDYDRNNYTEAYHELIRFYKEYVGEQTLPPFISFKDFKDLYNFYVFDLRHQSDHIAAKQIKLDFQFRAGYDAVAQNFTAFALILTNRVISISSDGNRQFDVI